MSFKKSVAIAAAAGALAAISVPAMALENEFHGIYNFNSTFSNFQDGGSGNFTPAGWKEDRQMNNFFEQRARLQYIAKASDDLRLVTHFELDSRFGTQRSSAAGVANGGNSGGLMETDSVTLETKHVYLDFNVGKDFNTKLGLMPYKDTIKGLFIDADMPMILTTTKVGAYTLGLGFSRFDDDLGVNAAGVAVAPTAAQAAANTPTARLGARNKDLFVMDNTFAISKDAKVALSYYFLADYATGTTGGVATMLDLANSNNPILLNTFALSAEAKSGPATLSGFIATQAGHQKFSNTTFGQFTKDTNTYFHGWAANVAAKVAAGSGTGKLGFLFTSGDNDKRANNNGAWVTSSTNSYNEGGMMILARNTGNSPTSNDRYIRRVVTNVALLTAGYDAKLSDKLFANTNIGMAWAPASAGAPVDSADKKANGCDLMGTEANLELGYKLYSNLTLKAQGAYMVLGSYYKNSAYNNTVKGNFNGPVSPENPYSARLHAQFAF